MTHQQPESEVHRLFSLLDPAIQRILTTRWKDFGGGRPTILTDPEHVDAASDTLGFTLDKGATDGVSMYFRIDRIESDGTDPRLFILHELVRCYLFAVGKFSLRKYREDSQHKRRCESETTRLST